MTQQNPWGGNKPNNKDQESIDELLNKSKEAFSRLFGGGNGDGDKSDGNGASIKTLIVIGFVALALWLASGIYVIKPDEEGVVLRFGAFDRFTGEGPHYHLPFPIEKLHKIQVTRQNTEEIGSSTSRGMHDHLMLTGDENIIDVRFAVDWRIKNAQDYLFNIKNPRQTVAQVAQSAMREVIGQRKLADAMTDAREPIQDSTKEIIQRVLDEYGAGIEIVRVLLKPVQAPEEVNAAFREVQTALAEKEQLINEAIEKRNKIIPAARGQAEKLLQEAEGYKQKVIAHAEGEAARFNSVYNEYKNAKEVTQKRIYIDTMQEIMTGMDKMVLDSNGGSGVVPYLPLNELNKRR